MNRIVSIVALVFLIGATFYATSCGDFFVSGNTLDHITLTPSSVFLVNGETKQFSASAVNVDGTTTDVTSSATWTTGSNTIATADATTIGLIKAVASTGNTTVTATQSGVNGVATLVVGGQALSTTLNVTDSNNNSSNLVVSTTQPLQLKATGTAGSSIDLTNFAAWTSSSTNFTVSNTGKVTVSGATSGQTATITATMTTATGSAAGTVTVSATGQ